MDIAISMDYKSEFGRGRREKWGMVSQGGIDEGGMGEEGGGGGRGVNLSLHSHACVLLVFSLTYEWVWELDQVGEC